VNYNFTDQESSGFISKKDIERIIVKQCDSLAGQLLDSINTSSISKTLATNPYIKNVHVFKSLNGEIQVNIERHIALVRIINQNNKSFYLSENGAVLPFSKNYTPFVMVASGNISEDYASISAVNYATGFATAPNQSILSSVHLLSKALKEHEYLNKFIEQIYVNKQGEFELVPSDGDHYIIVGNVDALQQKLNKLMAFYREGLPKMKDEFTSINLKFTNQVVCKK
jgi:cell division protein FtsQ